MKKPALELVTETTSTPITDFHVDPKVEKMIRESDLLSDLPEPKFLQRVNESVSGFVLGKMRGVFFKPDGISGNRRFYSFDLWNQCLESELTQERLRRGMVGSYEHPSVANITTADGLPTTKHPVYEAMVTKKLTIEKRRDGYYGIGEAYILNTPLGLILGTMLKATDENGVPLVKMFVSSRAWASAKDTTKDGIKILDEDTFFLESFDATRFPGVKEASPVFTPFVQAIESAIESVTEQDPLVDFGGLKSHEARAYLDTLKKR